MKYGFFFQCTKFKNKYAERQKARWFIQNKVRRNTVHEIENENNINTRKM